MSSEPERSAALTEAKAALAELTGQLLRIAAGAGDAHRMRLSLERLWRSLEVPGGYAIMLQHEANDALQFTVDPDDPIEGALDNALAGALGIVAARLEGSRVGELSSLSQLFDGMRVLQGGGPWMHDMPTVPAEVPEALTP